MSCATPVGYSDIALATDNPLLKRSEFGDLSTCEETVYVYFEDCASRGCGVIDTKVLDVATSHSVVMSDGSMLEIILKADSIHAPHDYEEAAVEKNGSCKAAEVYFDRTIGDPVTTGEFINSGTEGGRNGMTCPDAAIYGAVVYLVCVRTGENVTYKVVDTSN